MSDDLYKKYIFPSHQVAVDIINSEKKLPIGKVLCVGRNYKKHIKEMGESTKEEPFFFSKPAQSISQKKNIIFPKDTKNLQYEVELVVFIGKRCFEIHPNDAVNYIYGFSVGIDLTKRDLQKIAKENRRPWAFSKGFEDSAPISLVNTNIKIPTTAKIKLFQNGELKQTGDLSEMRWSVDDIISKISKKIILYPGDVIFTGTPSGVGSILPGDKISALIDEVGNLEIFFN